MHSYDVYCILYTTYAEYIHIDTHMKCDKETVSSVKCVRKSLNEQTKPNQTKANQTTKLNYTKPQNKITKTENKKTLSRTESRSF